MNDNFFMRRSFTDIFREIKTRTEAHILADKSMANTLCKIIAEVYIFPPGKVINIGGEEIDVIYIQEIFERLDYTHLEMVADNFANVKNEVKSVRAYLRTALYNSFFELDARIQNQVKINHD